MPPDCPACGGEFTGEHPQVGLTTEYGVHVHVDSGIADLVLACWDLGISTVGSCQGDPGGKTFLGFGAGSAQRFATAATVARTGVDFEQTPEGVLDSRIYELRGPDDPDGWAWYPGYPFDPGFGLAFPSSDLPEVTRRLQARVAELGVAP